MFLLLFGCFSQTKKNKSVTVRLTLRLKILLTCIEMFLPLFYVRFLSFRERVMTRDAIIFHYRKCRHHWITTKTCMENRPKIQDRTMVGVMRRMHGQINEIKKMLLGD